MCGYLGNRVYHDYEELFAACGDVWNRLAPEQLRSIRFIFHIDFKADCLKSLALAPDESIHPSRKDIGQARAAAKGR